MVLAHAVVFACSLWHLHEAGSKIVKQELPQIAITCMLNSHNNNNFYLLNGT